MDQDLVILNLKHDRYVGLDRVGRRIWELTESRRSVGAICAELEREFEGDPDRIRASVIAFVEEMIREDLVRVVVDRSP